MPSPNNPYPGARPLRAEDAGVLVGRAADLARFRSAVADVPLVAVLGKSGVGKSSLICAGLCGESFLKESGLIVGRVAEWESAADEDGDGSKWYVRVLSKAIEDACSRIEVLADNAKELAESWDASEISTEDAGTFVRRVEDHFGSSLVVVFDQFEELLRDRNSLGTSLLRMITQVAAAYPGGYCQVISLRAEFQSDLGEMWRQLAFNPAQKREIIVQEVDDVYIEELVVAPLMKADIEARLIERMQQLKEKVGALWEQANGPVAGADIGLLHLQALLYLLWKAEDDSPLLSYVDQFPAAVDLSDLKEIHQPNQFLANVLVPFIEDVLDREVRDRFDSSREGGVTEKNEVLRIAAHLPEFLSSGGYKSVLSTDDLAWTVLEGFNELDFAVEDLSNFKDRGLGDLPLGLGQGSEVSERVRPLVLAAAKVRREIKTDWTNSLLDNLQKQLIAEFNGLQLLDDGFPILEYGRSSRGHSQLTVACILIERFEEALGLLQRANLVRLAPSSRGRFVSLVHDGFGEPLDQWGLKVRSQPQVAIASPVPVTGRGVLFSPEADREALTQDQLGSTDSLGWIGCNIRAAFKDVVFDACNFSGTLFKGCSFENVTFTDCLTFGALFLDCEFSGTTTFATSGKDSAPWGTNELRSLTFGFGCTTTEGGVLKLEGFGGYGLFFDGFCGDVHLKKCQIAHLAIANSREEHQVNLITDGVIPDASTFGGEGKITVDGKQVHPPQG